MARAERSSPINTFSTQIGFGGNSESKSIFTILGGLGLVAIGIVLGALFFRDGYATNVYTEFLSVAATALVLDQLNRRRDRSELKQRLLNELRSSAVGQGTAALDWLRRENWIENDTLEDVDLYRVNWENAYIGDLNLEATTLIGAHFANVTNVITDDDGETESKPVNFIRANLRFANLERAQLWSVNMTSAALVNTNLAYADMISANLERVNARSANFRYAQLLRTNLQKAYLRLADLQGADLRYATLIGADLRQANLLGADLRHAVIEGVTWQGEDYKGKIIPAILPDGESWTPNTDMEKFTNRNHREFAETLAIINRIRVEIGLSPIG